MAMAPLVEGWTGPFELSLKRNGVPAIFTASAHAPTLILKSRGGAVPAMGGNLAWLTASCGAVTVTFDSTDLRSTDSPYLLRVRVATITTSSEVVFFPNGAAEQVDVYAP